LTYNDEDGVPMLRFEKNEMMLENTVEWTMN